jgi:hypothetical protein
MAEMLNSINMLILIIMAISFSDFYGGCAARPFASGGTTVPEVFLPSGHGAPEELATCALEFYRLQQTDPQGDLICWLA